MGQSSYAILDDRYNGRLISSHTNLIISSQSGDLNQHGELLRNRGHEPL